MGTTTLHYWVKSEGVFLHFQTEVNLPTFRWLFEPILDTIKLP